MGKSSAITSDGLANVADTLGVQAPEIWTVFSVETKGCGFLPDRRPPILLERHIFSRLTKRQFDLRDCSNPGPGGYGASGAAQYDRLAQAVALHRDAALQSCSWGLGQIMGENFAMLGFAGVEDMVAAMCETEDAQLLAYQKFSNGPLPDLTVRTAQLYLTYAGFHPGPVDGLPGALTQAALRQFQQKNGLPATGALDDATMAALQPAA